MGIPPLITSILPTSSCGIFISTSVIQTFYVELSRAKNEAVLIVDNKEAVQKTLKQNTGVKVAALDVVKEENMKVKGFDRD